VCLREYVRLLAIVPVPVAFFDEAQYREFGIAYAYDKPSIFSCMLTGQGYGAFSIYQSCDIGGIGGLEFFTFL